MSKLPEWVQDEITRRQAEAEAKDAIATCMHGVTSPCGICGHFQ